MRRRIATPGFYVAFVCLLIAVGLTFAAASGRLEWPRPADDQDTPAGGWTEVVSWNFADGECPEGWGWGTWQMVDGTLEMTSDGTVPAVYFVPADHGADFILETEVQLIDGMDGNPVLIHLLTRDSKQMTHESGMVVGADIDQLRVRHMVNTTNHILDVAASPIPLMRGPWYTLKFVVRGGQVSAFFDDVLVFESAPGYPPGLYREPHVAVESGTARFRSFRVFTAAES